MYWGIDGCKKGWIAIGLGNDAEYQYGVFSSLEDFWVANENSIDTVLVDIPIGLPHATDRNVESIVRKRVPERRSSMFPVPARKVLEFAAAHDFAESSYMAACELNQSILGKSFSKQTWNIMRKIYEADQFLQKFKQAQSYVFESHPEVLFWALNGHKPLRYPKKQGLGFLERLEILQQFQTNAFDIIQSVYDAHRRQLSDDDILDALSCAVSARLGRLRSIPENPTADETGLPMRIVYPTI